MKRVLFLSLAFNHSSAKRRRMDAQSDQYELVAPDLKVDRMGTTIKQRLLSLTYLRIFLVAWRERYDVIWAWGPDVCLLMSIACLFRPNTMLVWDISDINRHFLGTSVKARALRFLERSLIRRASLLLLTSEGFYGNYFQNAIAASKVQIIENLKSDLETKPLMLADISLRPIRFCYAGIFRSQFLLDQIFELSRLFPGEIAFHLHGTLDRNLRQDCLSADNLPPNVRYFGPFAQEDLATLYEQCHFTWGFVDTASDDNEKWLLTNRIYDAILYRRPILTNDNSYSGIIATNNSIGQTCHSDIKSVAKLIEHLLTWTPQQYKDSISTLPPAESALLKGHYRAALENLLDCQRM